MYRKCHGIAPKKRKMPKTSPQRKKKPEPETTSPREKQVFPEDANDNEVTDSDESDSSDFELERIVSGPCKTGPNKGKYCIKWVGYDTDEVIYVSPTLTLRLILPFFNPQNTWEPPANLSATDLREYQNKNHISSDIHDSSDSEDSTPIAKLVAQKKKVKFVSFFYF
jgi:hypothetical protein